MIYGGGLTTAAAYRWKCELNENAKLPAFSNTLPELDHNEIAGWEGGEGSRLAAVFIEDSMAAAREFAGDTGAVFIHPFDHPDVIAGQGTVGLEVL